INSLLTEVAAYRLDLLIGDAPIPSQVKVRAYNHCLGTSGVSFFAAARVFKGIKGKFPACLNGAPLLIPGEDTAVRPRLQRWLEGKEFRPRVIGEFDDSAFMKAFGQGGAGVFIGPTVLETEIEA
ncbi:MAG: LysR family transcriptional regulator, partial [Burkholderiales bacterium]